jgi:hypothetical protein
VLITALGDAGQDGGAPVLVQLCGGIAGIDPSAQLGDPASAQTGSASPVLNVQTNDGETHHFTVDLSAPYGQQVSAELLAWQQLTASVQAINDASAQSYDTPNGPRTLTQVTDELQKAGYYGPWDAASAVSTYRRTAQ